VKEPPPALARERGRYATLLALLAVALALQLGYGFMDHAPDYDEAFYMDLARGISRSGIPQPRPDAHIFLAHPPLFYYLESVLFLAGEPPLLVARLLSSAFSLLTLWILFSLVERVWDSKRAWVATGLLAVNPCFIYYSHSVYMESAVAAFSLLGFSFWLRALAAGREAAATKDVTAARRYNPAWTALKSGLTLGAAVLTKYLGGLYVAGCVVRHVFARRRELLSHRLLWAFLAGLATVSILWPLYALALLPHRFLSGLQFWFSRPEAHALAASWRTAGFLKFCAYAVGVLTPAFVLLMLAGLIQEGIRLAKRRTEWLAREVVWTGVMILGCFTVFSSLAPRRDVKYLAVILPLLAIYASGPIASLLGGRKKWVSAVVIVGLFSLMGPGTYLYDPTEGRWLPNLVIFSLLRDGRYVDLMEMGKMIRRERPPGAILLAEFKNSLLGYYGDLEAKNGWGMGWEELSPLLDEAAYYLKASDAPQLPPEEASERDRQLAAEFMERKRAQRGEIVQILYRRTRAPGSST